MQGRRLLLTTLSGLSALLFSAPSQADLFGCLPTCNMSAPCGWYLEGNIGWTKISFNNVSTGTSSQNIGYNINFGYKFMPYFAMEIGGTKYPNSSFRDNDDITIVNPSSRGSLKFYSYDLAGKGIVPISDSGVELFAKLGVARMNASASFSGPNTTFNGNRNTTGYYIGVGGQYYFTPEFAAVVQWQRAQSNNNGNATFDLYSLGLSYIIG